MKKIFQFSIINLLVTACIPLFSVNANAASGLDCPDGKFCLWQHPHYEGMLVYSSKNQLYVGSVFDDRASSLWNRTNRPVCIFQHKDFQGWSRIIPAGEYIGNLKSLRLAPTHQDEGGNFNDRISSFKPC